MRIGIGIDTGGTYTDAVAYDFENNKILGCAKSLTTKDDLSIGILGAIDGLPMDILKKAELVSISTTLATNACVEDKGGNAKLIFLGGDELVIDKNGGKYGLPHSSEIYLQESFTKFSGEILREPDWDQFKNNIKSGFEEVDGVGIVEINAMRNGAVVEKRAKEVFEGLHDIPVVCGHELFSDLNCLQRASSTLLNARLFPVIREFLEAITHALSERKISASIVIVRSDGTLMSEKFASLRPVETLLCGPAASAVGGAQLSDCENSIIVDMGGTTTDIALVRNRIPVSVVDGVRIGKWKTYVSGLYVKTIGLGGDSAIHYASRNMVLEDYRVVPLCIAAEKYPAIVDNLRLILAESFGHTKYLHEHYMLVKDISNSSRYTVEEKAFCAAIKKCPLPLRSAAESIGRDVYTFDISRLIREGVVQVCGLTPTDIMHIKKDFVKYSTAASEYAAEFVAMNLNVSVEMLCDMVYDEIERKMFFAVVKSLLENTNNYYIVNGISSEVERFIESAYIQAKSGKVNPLLSLSFKTDFSLVGIGAPISIFLGRVAKLLNTNAIVSEYSPVANAYGAIVGNICAKQIVEIKPNYVMEEFSGYTVFSSTGNTTINDFEKAKEFAIIQACEAAKEEVLARGAKGEIAVSYEVRDSRAKTKVSSILLGTYVTAQAMGSVGFNSQKPQKK